MNLKDYLLDTTGWNWGELLRHWKWILPPRFTLWMVNRFGDLFLCLEDGSVHHLDVGAGTLSHVASSRDAFCELVDESGKAAFFFMIPLVDKLTAAGLHLSSGESYSYRLAPAFGGSFELENIAVRPASEHYAIFGPQHEQTKNLPDGTKIKFNTDNQTK